MTTFFGLPLPDLLVILGYFAVALLIGYLAMRFVKNQEDYFLGGRGFGKTLQIFGAFGQATSSDTAVGAVTTSYQDGAGGIWSQLNLLWSTPLYWLTSPWYRRLRIYTMGEFFFERYRSRRLAMIYAVLASFFLVLIITVSLKAMSATVLGMTLKPAAELTVAERAERADADRLAQLTQQAGAGKLTAGESAELTRLREEQPRRDFSSVNEHYLVWSVLGVVFFYGLAGGLRGAIWTDVFQGCLIFVLAFLLFPFAIQKLETAHGIEGIVAVGRLLHERLPGHFFSPFGSAQSAQFTWYFILALCAMTTINVAAQANQLTSNAGARDEHTASVGFMTGVMLKRYLTVAWGLLALLCYALYSTEIKDPDLVWGHATRDLLGAQGYGLVGLMIACMLAALQSTASSLAISASTLMTRDVYVPLRPGRSERHYVTFGRVCGGFFLIAAGLMCTAFDTLLGLLKFMWEFNAIIAAAFWCGMKWRGATRAGAWASIGVSGLLFIVLPFSLPALFPSLRQHPEALRQTMERIVPVTYAATAHDVTERAAEIARWQGPGPAPAALAVGDKLERPVVVAPSAICWSQNPGRVEGQLQARGVFYPEMYVLDRIFDLSGNPFALNETIRYAYKILLPFLVLIGVSLATRRDDSPEVARFFLRMRTKVRAHRPDDAAALAAAYADPESTRRVLLFPATRLELQKWERSDYIGVGLGTAGVVLLILLFQFALNIGA